LSSVPDNGRPSTLRDRRKRETRNQIRRIALQLVEERGYDAVTVDLISERAGVSVRTFFNYFASKESAMVATPPPVQSAAAQKFLSHRGRKDLFAHLAELAASQLEGDDPLPSDFESAMQIVMGVPALAKLQFAALVDIETQFVELIAQRLGLGVDDEQPAVIAAAFMGAVRVAGQRWSQNPEQRSLSDEVRACLSFLSVE
jgi:AcrR family transcriptional regulator